MAKRIQDHVKATTWQPPTQEQETAILLDWLEGMGVDKVASKHKRGQLTVRRVLDRYKAEAKAVLDVSQVGNVEVHNDR